MKNVRADRQIVYLTGPTYTLTLTDDNKYFIVTGDTVVTVPDGVTWRGGVGTTYWMWASTGSVTWKFAAGQTYKAIQGLVCAVGGVTQLFNSAIDQWLVIQPSTAGSGQPGPQGPVGPVGPAGATGPAGPTGNTGAAGPTGPIGPAGPNGNTGPQGTPGIAGNDGATGAQGPLGAQGEAGKDGKDGRSFEILGYYDTYDELVAAHPVGKSGDCYLVGKPGALFTWDSNDRNWQNSGIIEGPKGDQGPLGPQGIQGSAGSPGQDGATGPQGIPGITGAQGPKGDTGLVGPNGPSGPAGPKGDKGDRGPAGPGGGNSLIVVKTEIGNYTLEAEDNNVLFLAHDYALAVYLPTTDERPDQDIGTHVRITDVDPHNPLTLAQFVPTWGARIISPLGRMAAVSGQAIEAIKVTDTTWLVTGQCAINPNPPSPRPFNHLGGGTGIDQYGDVLGDTIRVAWAVDRAGIVAQEIKIIDNDTGTVLFDAPLDPDAVFYQSALYEFATWTNFRAEVTITDLDNRVSVGTSPKFYGMGRPTPCVTWAQSYRCDTELFASVPRIVGDISVQTQSNQYQVYAQVKIPGGIANWQSSNIASDVITTLKVVYYEPVGEVLPARYIMSNEFGKVISNFNIKIGSGPQSEGVVEVSYFEEEEV